MKKKKRPLLGHDLIAQERARQVAEEGYTSKHDDHHEDWSMAMAAACYASAAAGEMIYVRSTYARGIAFNDPWPWAVPYDKRPYNGHTLDPKKIEDMPDAAALKLLVKAGALIAAEIDRLQRKKK